MKAAYKYQAEDVDELQFEVGEVIDVVEYEDPEEQVQILHSFYYHCLVYVIKHYDGLSKRTLI